MITETQMEALYFANKYYPKANTGQNFTQEINFSHQRGVAYESNNIYFASGINRGGHVLFLSAEEAKRMSLEKWIELSFGDSQPASIEKMPGRIYKRIFRPIAIPNSGLPRGISYDEEVLVSSAVSLKMLIRRMETLFETVEPVGANLKTYGHSIRELLLLACMEVESAWSAVLRDNGYSSRATFSTNDYVKLAAPMLLDAYELSLSSYSGFPSFYPFKNWDMTKPTQSLDWYDAYNKTKHDRETYLSLATLENVVRAVGAVVVMFNAQFGYRPLIPGSHQFEGPVQNIFKFVTIDMEKYEKEFYLPEMTLDLSQPEHLKAQGSLQWKAENYPF